MSFNCINCKKSYEEEVDLRAHTLFEHGSIMPNCSTRTFEITYETVYLFKDFLKHNGKKFFESKKKFKKQLVCYAVRWIKDNYPSSLGTIKMLFDYKHVDFILEREPNAKGEYEYCIFNDLPINQIEEYFHNNKPKVNLIIYSKRIPKDMSFRKEVDFISDNIFGHDEKDWNNNEINRGHVLRRLLVRQRILGLLRCSSISGLDGKTNHGVEIEGYGDKFTLDSRGMIL